MTGTPCAETASRDAESLEAARVDCAAYRILSTLPFTKTQAWDESVQTLLPKRRRLQRLWQSTGVTDPLLIFKLLARARHADAVLLNGGERVDLLYLALAGLLPWIRAPHLIVDAHWQPHGGLTGRLQRWILRLGRRLLHEVQPHSPEENDVYVRHFGVDRRVIRPLPWSTSLNGYDITPREPRANEAVSGGFSYRDYPTLFEAMRRCGLPLRVGLPPSRATERARKQTADCAHIRIVSDWTFQQYWQAVADARVFVMALTPGLRRCSADQTLLNAMSFGTVVVATDSMSSRLYIRDGENGFLVPENDPQALADTLRRVFTLAPQDYQRISRQAALDVQTHYREEQRLARTLQRALTAARHYRVQRAQALSRPTRAARVFGMLALLL